jgi:DNA-binding XRE family transcriptional regulator
MQRGVPITDDEEAAIKTALQVRPHASAVARDSKGAWSYSTVWRVADRAGIALTAGRETMGRKRLAAEQVAAVREMSRANPKTKQADIARATGVSRPSVSKIEGGRRYRKRCVLAVVSYT